MTDQLAHDHADLDKLLGELRTALDAGDIARSHARLDLFWARLGMHIRAEHLQLFPVILLAVGETREGDVGNSPSLSQAQNAIEELRRDHNFFMHELSRAIASMRDLLTITDQQVAAQELEEVRARIIAVSERLAVHNRLEEDQVYLWTGSLLSEAQQSELEARVHNELGNMPPRFGAGATSNDRHTLLAFDRLLSCWRSRRTGRGAGLIVRRSFEQSMLIWSGLKFGSIRDELPPVVRQPDPDARGETSGQCGNSSKPAGKWP